VLFPKKTRRQPGSMSVELCNHQIIHFSLRNVREQMNSSSPSCFHFSLPSCENLLSSFVRRGVQVKKERPEEKSSLRVCLTSASAVLDLETLVVSLVLDELDERLWEFISDRGRAD
jgi:hypothetical protein